MTPLAGRRILLIGIGFYDYEKAIVTAMTAMGAQVRHVVEQPPAPTAVHRKWGIGAAARLARHHRSILDLARDMGPLDHVVVIKGQTLTPDFLAELRQIQPSAQLTAYHWDSVQRSPALLAMQDHYDQILTFDHRDAARYPRFVHRPLFFRPELGQCPAGQPSHTLSFVGWLHHDRLGQIERLITESQRHGWTMRVHLSTGRFTALRHGRMAGREFVKGRPLAFADYVALVCDSRAVIDLPHPEQSGLTMRTVEVGLGAGRKLVTTSRDVIAYDFYDPANILTVDMNQIDIPQDFLDTPFRDIDPDLRARYGIQEWLLDILDPDRLRDKPFITAGSLSG